MLPECPAPALPRIHDCPGCPAALALRIKPLLPNCIILPPLAPHLSGSSFPHCFIASTSAASCPSSHSPSPPPPTAEALPPLLAGTAAAAGVIEGDIPDGVAVAADGLLGTAVAGDDARPTAAAAAAEDKPLPARPAGAPIVAAAAAAPTRLTLTSVKASERRSACTTEGTWNEPVCDHLCVRKGAAQASERHSAVEMWPQKRQHECVDGAEHTIESGIVTLLGRIPPLPLPSQLQCYHSFFLPPICPPPFPLPSHL